MRRRRSCETRLAVRFATQPSANSSRALAMSSFSESTATPTAEIESGTVPTQFSTMSITWIMRSNTTSMSSEWSTRACFSPHVPTPHTPIRKGARAGLPGFTGPSARETADRSLGEAREVLDRRIAGQLRADLRNGLAHRQAQAEQDPVGALERLRG